MDISKYIDIIKINSQTKDSSFLDYLANESIFDLPSFENLIEALEVLKVNIEENINESTLDFTIILQDLYMIDRICLILISSHFDPQDKYVIKATVIDQANLSSYIYQVDAAIFTLQKMIFNKIY